MGDDWNRPISGASRIVTPDLIGNYPCSTSHCSPAKAGVQMAQRYHAWTPAFAGEQLPTCLKGIYPDLIRGPFAQR